MIMRIRGIIREYDLDETAIILGIPSKKLLKEVREGELQHFYRRGKEYKFHDASLEENRHRLKNKRTLYRHPPNSLIN